MKRILFPALLFGSVMTFAHAASFDCNKAATPTEKAICSNAELSDLDSDLSKEYARALRGDKEKANFVRDGQKSWITSTRDAQHGDVNQLLSAYRERLTALQIWNTPESEGTNFAMGTIAKHYRFTLHLYRACDVDTQGSMCEGPARLTIRSKDDPQFSQNIYMENIEVPMAANQKPLTNSSRLYDYQGAINVGDFNFDGREDFAIQVGEDGPYGGPRFDVYLNSNGRFVYNAALSELTQEKLGLFAVDHKNREIDTIEKDGCCWHKTTRYHMIDDQPVEFEHTIEDALHIADMHSDQEFVYTERLVNQHWMTVKIEGARYDGFCEAQLLEAVKEEPNPTGSDVMSQTACHLLPNDSKTGIAAATFKSKDRQIGLDVAYVDMGSGDVMAKSRISDAYILADDTPIYVDSLLVDTARYQITPTTRAIGIRTEFKTQINAWYFTLLTLFERDGNRVTPALENLVIDRADGSTITKRTIEIGKTTNKGYADLIVHETKQQKDKDSDVATRDYTLRFDGTRYVVPDELKRRLW